jgi:hypothetical protein
MTLPTQSSGTRISREWIASSKTEPCLEERFLEVGSLLRRPATVPSPVMKPAFADQRYSFWFFWCPQQTVKAGGRAELCRDRKAVISWTSHPPRYLIGKQKLLDASLTLEVTFPASE